MTASLHFEVTFHGPFHVARGAADDGLDRLVDTGNLLPASSLKGRMRAAARDLVGAESALLAATFGSRRQAAAWAWSDAEFPSDAAPAVTQVSRIKISDQGAVEKGYLMLGQHVWASTARFTVNPIGTTSDDQLHLLRAAALAVTSLGGSRTRGEGWVTIKDRDRPAWTPQDTDRLRGLRS